MNIKNWSLQTRFLHLGLVGTVTAQLATSLIMSDPDEKGGGLGHLAFEAHEKLGLTALGIALMHWMWSIFSQADRGLKYLFPWGKDGRQAVMADLKYMRTGRFSKVSKRGGLPGLVHGLGLLAVTATAMVGGVIFVLLPESGSPGALAEAFMELHEGLATLVWAYWIGHGGAALIHHFSGDDVLWRMFNLGSDKELDDNQQVKSQASKTLEQH